MSTVKIPTISLPAHSVANALDVLFDRSTLTKDLMASGMIGREVVSVLSPDAEDMLRAFDMYLKKAATETWLSTSFYTGNTRGSLRQVGNTYRDTDIILDVNLWSTPKELPSLKERVVTATWKTKAGKKSKTYRYPAGRMVKITGEDYSGRIPMPPHFGDDIGDLVEVYEEMKEDEFRKAGF